MSLSSCKNNGQNISNSEESMKNEIDKEFETIITEIKTSNTYESPTNWEERGLNQSENSIVKLLRETTNEFLNELTLIHNSSDSEKLKLERINKIVDNLPWSSLDTEEKEFLADVLAPAIHATGFNPWTIF